MSVRELYAGPALRTSHWEGAEGSVGQGGRSHREGALSLGGGQSPSRGRWALCKALSAAPTPPFLDTKLYNEPSRNWSWKNLTPEYERCSIFRQKIKPVFPKARCRSFSGLVAHGLNHSPWDPRSYRLPRLRTVDPVWIPPVSCCALCWTSVLP